VHQEDLVYLQETIQTKEVKYVSGLGSEKTFELSVAELSDLGTILACMYRSPDSDFDKFLSKLEILITEVHSKGKQFSVVIYRIFSNLSRTLFTVLEG
jgi:cystathionine beta-lyase/cystathionine gamma-synthase